MKLHHPPDENTPDNPLYQALRYDRPQDCESMGPEEYFGLLKDRALAWQAWWGSLTPGFWHGYEAAIRNVSAFLERQEGGVD